MGWAHIQDTPGSNNVNATGSGTTQALTAFGSAVTLGDQVIVWAWGTSGSAIVAANVTCSDNGATPNSYTQLIFAVQGTNKWVAIFEAATITSNPNSGNLVPTVTSSVTTGLNACGSEFSGGSSATDGSNSAVSGSPGTAPAPGNITTTSSADLLLTIFTDASGLNPETITSPGSYTSTGIQTNGSSFDCGQGMWWIPNAIVTNNNPTWTLGDSVNWSAAQIALKAGGGIFDSKPVHYRMR